MACTCKEDFEVIGNVKIGRNRVMCQECIDRLNEVKKEEVRRAIIIQLEQLDKKLIRSLSEGETDRVQEIVAQKEVLRAELAKI